MPASLIFKNYYNSTNKDIISFHTNQIMKFVYPKTKNNNTATKTQRAKIQQPKEKEQQYSAQKTMNNTTTKSQSATIQRPKDKDQQH